MRPTGPASTTSSPTSTRSAWTPTAGAPSECRALVPALSPALRGGIEVPGDHHVDNRALLGALVRGLPRRRRARSSRARVTRCGARARARPGGRPPPRAGPRRPGGRDRPACHRRPGRRRAPDRAARSRATSCASAPATACGPAPPLLARTVRGLVHGRSVYLVPRRDGSLVVGATVEERGVDTAVQAGAVHELLCDARAIVPGVDELELLEASAGLRPATPDNMPRIGWTGLDGVVAAVGHYRNGILLAPLTAAAVVDLVGRRPVGAAHRGAGAGVSDVAAARQRRAGAGAAPAPPSPTSWPRLDRGRGRQGGGRRRRPLRRPALGVGHHARPCRLPGRSGERRRRRVSIVVGPRRAGARIA